MTSDRYGTWDAAYVLGSLSTDERAEYEEHLAVCAECRAAAGDLAGLPGILGRLDRETAVAIVDGAGSDSPGPRNDLVPRLAHRVARRRGVVRIAAGALVVVAAVAGLLLGGIAPGPGKGGRTLDLASVDRSTVTAHLAVSATPWGTRLDWSCSYGTAAAAARYAHADYEMTVTTADGRTHQVASWSAVGRTSTGLSASVALPEGSIRSVAIRDEAGTALATGTL